MGNLGSNILAWLARVEGTTEQSSLSPALAARGLIWGFGQFQSYWDLQCLGSVWVNPYTCAESHWNELGSAWAKRSALQRFRMQDQSLRSQFSKAPEHLLNFKDVLQSIHIQQGSWSLRVYLNSIDVNSLYWIGAAIIPCYSCQCF